MKNIEYTKSPRMKDNASFTEIKRLQPIATGGNLTMKIKVFAGYTLGFIVLVTYGAIFL
jgi:hypothetical protein